MQNDFTFFAYAAQIGNAIGNENRKRINHIRFFRPANSAKQQRIPLDKVNTVHMPNVGPTGFCGEWGLLGAYAGIIYDAQFLYRQDGLSVVYCTKMKWKGDTSEKGWNNRYLLPHIATQAGKMAGRSPFQKI